jgi:hypothetical protein
MLLAIAAFVGGTATLVVFQGATTVIIYYVVGPLVVGLILFLQRSYRRLRRKAGSGSGFEAETTAGELNQGCAIKESTPDV